MQTNGRSFMSGVGGAAVKWIILILTIVAALVVGAAWLGNTLAGKVAVSQVTSAK